jgi:hypothetical protein
MADWLSIIPNHERIGIPRKDFHLFQIFAMIACDQLWFSRNKAHHEDLIPNTLVISATINKLALKHHFGWSSKLIKTLEVWKKPNSPYLKINYDIAIRDSFSTQASVGRFVGIPQALLLNASL